MKSPAPRALCTRLRRRLTRWGLLGGRYVGDWEAAKKHGQGELYYANGDMFRGEWVADRASGSGVLMYANNNRYEGQWLDDRRHGQGTFYHADGSRYEGEWATGRKEVRGAAGRLHPPHAARPLSSPHLPNSLSLSD